MCSNADILRRSLALIAIVATLAACNRSATHYVAVGDSFYQQGKYADAEINYRRALQKDGSNAAAWAGMGLTAVRLQKPADAYKNLSRATEMLPARDDLKIALANVILFGYTTGPRLPRIHAQLLQLADQLQQKSPYDAYRIKAYLAVLDLRPSEASDLFAKANAAKPMQPELVFRWAQILFQTHQFDKAEKLSLDLIQRVPAYGPIYDLLFAAYTDARQPDQAEKILQKRVANNPKDAASIQLLASYYYAHPNRRSQVAATLQPLLEDQKAFPNGYLLAGDFYAQRREWDEAARLYEAGSKLNPKDPASYAKKIASVYAQRGNEGQATATLRQLTKESPADDQAHAALAASLLRAGTPQSLQEALTEYQGLAKRHPSDATYVFNWGRVSMAQENSEDAWNRFQQAAALNKRYLEPRLALAEMAETARNYKETLHFAEEALQIAPANRTAVLLRVAGLRGTARYSEARLILDDLLKKDPKNRDVRLQLALLELAQKQYRQAEQDFTSLSSDDSRDTRPIMGLAETYAAQNQPEKAFELIRAESKKPSAPESLHDFLAGFALQYGKYDVALDEYRQLLAIHPNSAPLYSHLGIVYSQRGDLPDAIANFQHAVSLSPRRFTSMALLARTLNQAGRTQEAIQAYRAALAIDPHNALMLNDLAFLLAESGANLDEALRLAKQAVALGPKESNFADTLGWVYLKQGHIDSALQIFRTTVQQNPDSPDFRYHLGVALWRSGDAPNAKSQLQTALAKGPSPKVGEEIRGILRTALAR
ncbi:MAG: tetratricopeptide repeat protein [Acidobacteriia bacterium]|nr:tetratricopeptide repeat protein [Terriglobia bacterium]